jgi:uncharacterized protein
MPLTFAFLGLAAIAVWGAAASSVPWRRWLWRAPLGVAAFAAMSEGFVDWRGIPFLAALWVSAELYGHASEQRRRLLLGAVALVLAGALATHRLPGFEPFLVAESLRLSPASAEVTLKANFDKAFAGILVLVCFCAPARTLGQWRQAIATGLLVGTGTAAVVIGLAVAAGAVGYDPKVPPVSVAWMASNLMLTCIFEEALFRGAIQDRLARRLVDRGRWAWLPLVTASLLFGLAHGAGGPVLVAVATMAGIGYGVAYALTGRVEAAIVAHFTLNALHFFGFTYPYAVR